MASNFESAIHRGSDLFHDFCCFPCEENDRNAEAEFYCKECSKFFCGKCVELHNSLYKKHAMLGKENISQWPKTNVDALLEQCQEHKKELTGFCEDHSELICHVCHVHNHKKCSHVVLIPDRVKDLHQRGDFKQLSATLDTLHGQFIQKKDDFEENMKTLEKSYNTILKEINALRKQINDSLDQLERNTIKELDTLLATLRTSIKTDIENCTESINNTTFLKEDWLRRKDKSEALSLVMYRKCLDWSINTTAVLQEMTTKNERTLTFNPDTTIQQTLSTLSGLGQILNQMKQSQMDKSTTQNTVIRQDNPKASNTVSSQQHPTRDSNKPSVICDPNQVIRVKSSRNMMNMMNSVKIKSDSNKCCISGICETASGELLISDFGNNNVKLLDQTYKVVAHCNLPNRPMSMCSINLRLVAVALDNSEIQFIKVTNGQLVQDRTLKLQHFCYGIAHHQGNLYITSGTALHHYTVDGRLVSKMFTSGLRAVTKCAVGPDGDRIYVVNSNSKQLITLSRDGTVISSLTDPALKYEYLHVSDSGQVLVCGGYCTTIIQVDRDGRRRLAEVVTVKGGVDIARSVFYSKHTGKLIVGMWNKFNNNDIMVFDTQ